MEKVIPNFPAKVIPKPLLGSISAFLAKGDSDVLVPPLVAWANVIRELDFSLETWMVVDLLRAAMADKRVSGWFAIDGLDILAGIIKTVNARDETEWQLRVITVQLVFSCILWLMADFECFFDAFVDGGESWAEDGRVG
jgi:hypothetical protein